MPCWTWPTASWIPRWVRCWSPPPSADLVRLAYQREDHDAVLHTLAERVSPRLLHAPRQLDEAARQLGDYFAGQRREFGLPLDLRLSRGFRRQVLDHLVTIGYGHQESYAAVANLTGHPKAVRGRRVGLRHQSDPDHRAVSPRSTVRRLPRRIRRGTGGQAGAAPAGRRQMTHSVGVASQESFTL